MKEWMKKNINLVIAVMILISPILDAFTGLSVHFMKGSLTIGIIVRMLFLCYILFTILFCFKKKKVILPYTLIFLYGILYLAGILYYKEGVGLFQEIQGLVKAFYFPILFLSLYQIREEIKISSMTLFTTLCLYLILIFVPFLFGIGFQSYEITKAGTLGFYHSANEISGIISLLTPIFFILLFTSKKIIPKFLFLGMYFTVIFMMGTKTPLLTLALTIGFCLMYLWIHWFQKKVYSKIVFSMFILGILLLSFSFILPKTNFYKNIETHLDYLKLDHITDVFQEEEFIDHFIFSQRLTFLRREGNLYHKASIYQKLFGIGYLEEGKPTKLVEMDYFDIYFHHGIFGFVLYFSIIFILLFKLVRQKNTLTFSRYMLGVSIWYAILLSFFTGHIMTAPSVSFLLTIIMVSFEEKKKKRLLFTAVSLDLGGIERALLNLVNRINLKKYEVEIILEEKKGIFLDQLKSSIKVTELKVSNHANIFVRKLLNYTRKLIYSILEYQNYDFSCCYATYSYSSSKLALLSSNNTAFYVHNDYKTIYPEEEEFRRFFDSRNITRYKHICFVSEENKTGFIEVYPELKEKCHVLNNFIDVKEIIQKAEETVDIKKPSKKTLLVYVGRLDDDAKKISRQIELVENIKDLELWIVGDGPDRGRYEREVEEKKLQERVLFLGRQKNPYPYMKMADYVILTSDYEGFPVIYLEALALHQMVITTFPTKDDGIDIREYGYVISKEKEEMIKEVKNILKEKKNHPTLDLEEIQKTRMENLEEIFNEVV